MTLVYVRWKDASYHDGEDSLKSEGSRLSELQEVGFLHSETEDCVTVCLERSVDDTEPGRWFVNVPKVNIVEMRTAELDKAFPVRRRRVRKL